MKERTKQDIARERNWLKARMLCIPSSAHDTMTDEEREDLREIHIIKQKLIFNWEKNSIKLGMKAKIKEEPL